MDVGHVGNRGMVPGASQEAGPLETLLNRV